MLTLAALLLMLQSSGPNALADPLPADIPCPTAHQVPDGPDRLCFGAAGPNHAFAFAYPVEAAQVPELERQLRGAKDQVWQGFQELIGFASLYPEDRFVYEEVYRLDASTAELLALSSEVWEQAGASARRTGAGAVLWDRQAAQGIAIETLFTDAEAAFREMERLACPALAAIRSPEHEGECVRPGHDARPIAGAGGNVITGWRILFGDLDDSGGGDFEIRIPVTPAMLELVQPRYRASFVVSDLRPIACNDALAAHRCPPHVADRSAGARR